MADEIYRQEKKKFQNPNQQPGINSNVPLTGKLPPHIAAALLTKKQFPENEDGSGDNTNSMSETPTMQELPKQPQRLKPREPAMRVTGSEKLEALLAQIRDTSYHFEEVTLPSLGKFYNDQDGPANGKLHIRPMTGEEEAILATPRFVRKGQAINMIFERCIKEKFDTSKFLTPDRTFLLIYLRGISYSPDYDVEVKCPGCAKKFNHTINLDSDVMVNLCPEDFGQDSLTDVLPTTGFKFSYNLATGVNEQKVQEYRDRKVRDFDTSQSSDDSILHRTAMLINEIEGLADKNEIKALLRKLPINDLAYLRNCVNEPPFGVDTNVDVLCEFCSYEFSMELPLEANFFFPKVKKKMEPHVNNSSED